MRLLQKTIPAMITRQTYPLFLGLLWLLFACGPNAENGTERPDNLVDEDRMVAILTEVHLNEAKVGKLNLRSSDSSNLVYKRLERQLLKKYDVDTSAYSRSYIYYASHPEAMERLYKRVVEKLQPPSVTATTSATTKPA